MASPLLRMAGAVARVLPAPLKRALYRMGPLTRGLRRALNRAAPDGPTEIEVAGGGLLGARLLLDLRSEKDYWLGSYEMDLQRAFADWLRPGQVVYDCGANIGYFSLLAARQVGERGQVYAFEALPANQRRLQANLALNPGGAVVEIVLKAVAGVNGRAAFLVHASGGMGKVAGSAGRSESYRGQIEVETVTLDYFVYAQGHPTPDAIKLDIEGGEAAALAGMQRLLREKYPRLFIELHGPEAARDVWRLLTEAGYSLHHLNRHYTKVWSAEELDWKSYLMAEAQNG